MTSLGNPTFWERQEEVLYLSFETVFSYLLISDLSIPYCIIQSLNYSTQCSLSFHNVGASFHLLDLCWNFHKRHNVMAKVSWPVFYAIVTEQRAKRYDFRFPVTSVLSWGRAQRHSGSDFSTRKRACFEILNSGLLYFSIKTSQLRDQRYSEIEGLCRLIIISLSFTKLK